MKHLKTKVFIVLISALLLINWGCDKKSPTQPDRTDGETEIIDPSITVDSLINSIEIPDSLTNPSILDDSTLIETSELIVERNGNPEIWICHEFERDANLAPEEYVLLRPSSSVIWPGAALQGRSIRRATPDPITAKRGPGKIVITNLTGTYKSNAPVDEMSLSNVYNAANEIIANQSADFPAFFSLTFQKVRTTQELQIWMKASASYFGISAAASFNFTENDTISRYLVSIAQSFYTLAYERPTLPSEFFHESVTTDHLQNYISSGNPPVYVSQVNYGRIFYLLIESDANWSELSASISASFVTGDFSGGIKYLTSLQNLRVQAFALGGDQNEVVGAIMSGYDNLQVFLDGLRRGNQINAAVPLSFEVRSVSRDILIKNAISTRYTYRECIPTDFRPCVPSPIYPVANQQLPNGCTRTPHPFTWTFNWSECEGASEYQILIAHPDINPYREIPLSNTTSYSFNPGTAFGTSNFYKDWYWMVKAKTKNIWGDYSSAATFNVDSINTACPTGIWLFEHPEYEGSRRWITVDTPDLDLGTINFADVTSSIKIMNLKGVQLWDGHHYSGEMLYFDKDVPDLRNHNFNDRLGSLRLLK